MRKIILILALLIASTMLHAQTFVSYPLSAVKEHYSEIDTVTMDGRLFYAFSDDMAMMFVHTNSKDICIEQIIAYPKDILPHVLKVLNASDSGMIKMGDLYFLKPINNVVLSYIVDIDDPNFIFIHIEIEV